MVLGTQQNGVNVNQVPPPGTQVYVPSEEDEDMERDGDFTEGEEELDFDDDVPAHRRMTVTRVTDHAELAASLLSSAQSAPMIELNTMSSAASSGGQRPLGGAQTIKIEQYAQ